MDQARAILTHFSGPERYFLFYITLASCGIGAPFNSDLLLIAASVLAALGYFNLWILIPLAFLGLMTGDSINFWVARTYGSKILSVRPFSWVVSPEKLKKGEDYLNRKGTRFLFMVRFFPLIRTPLYFAAGSLKVKPSTFYGYDISSTLIYLFALMTASFYASANIDPLIAAFKQIQLFLLGAVVVFLSVLILRKKRKDSFPHET
jgi:membrane-associated protein